MRTIKTITLLILLGLQSFALFAQEDPSQKLLKSIKAADSKGISDFLQATVDVSIENNNELCAKHKAADLLQQFFQRNPVTEVSINHRSIRQGARSFVILTYKCKNGTSYRINFSGKESDGNLIIENIKIDKI
jgi:hypothetical protein